MVRPLTVAIISICAWSVVAQAQWIRFRQPESARLPDGKPDLAASRRHVLPMVSQIFPVPGAESGRYGSDVTLDLRPGDIQPWAQALAKQRQETLAKDDPANSAVPPQGPRANLVPFNLAKIVQIPGLLVIFSEDMSFRQIFIDGRQLPRI